MLLVLMFLYLFKADMKQRVATRMLKSNKPLINLISIFNGRGGKERKVEVKHERHLPTAVPQTIVVVPCTFFNQALAFSCLHDDNVCSE
jgi:hypothetical protein